MPQSNTEDGRGTVNGVSANVGAVASITHAGVGVIDFGESPRIRTDPMSHAATRVTHTDAHLGRVSLSGQKGRAPRLLR